jgi:hypothetical protein
MPAAIRRAGWDRQQRFHQRPQLIRHEVINEGRHDARSCQTFPKERNDVLGRGAVGYTALGRRW